MDQKFSIYFPLGDIGNNNFYKILEFKHSNTKTKAFHIMFQIKIFQTYLSVYQITIGAQLGGTLQMGG